MSKTMFWARQRAVTRILIVASTVAVVSGCEFSVPASLSNLEATATDARGGIKGKPTLTPAPTAQPTLPPQVSPIATPTATPIPPAPTNAPTPTPVPPTATPRPTSTPIPPTSTPVPAPAIGWAAKCAAEPMPTSNVFYVCDCVNKGLPDGADSNCVPGSDSNPGTITQPFQSWLKVQAAWRALPAGGTVAICKGGRLNTESGGVGWVNSSCSASSPCTMRDYTPSWPSQAKPLIVDVSTGGGKYVIQNEGGFAGFRFLNLRFLRPGWNVLSQISPNGYAAWNSGRSYPAGAKVNYNSGTWQANVASLGQTPVSGSTYWTSIPGRPINASSNTILFRFGPNSRDSEVCNVEMEGFDLAFQLWDDPTNCQNARWKVHGNRVLNGSGQGFLVTGVDLDFDGNYFDNNATNLSGVYAMESAPGMNDGWPWGPTTHTFYASGTACPLTNFKFRNNEVHRNAMYMGYAQGSAVKIKSQGSDILVENNLVTFLPPHPGNYGGTTGGIVSDIDGDFKNLGFERSIVRRNRVIGGHSNGFIALASHRNSVIEDNVIVHVGGIGTGQGDDSGIRIAHSAEDPVRPSQNNVIRNNTIYYFSSTSDRSNGIHLNTYTSGGGNIITGNSITFANGGSASCFRFDAYVAPGYVYDLSKIVFMNNNSCSGASGYAALDASITYTSLSAWQANNPGKDANSILPAVAGQFVNPTQDLTADFTPAVGSLLLNAASTATMCTVAGVTNQQCTSPWSIDPADASAWNATDLSKSRGGAPFDIGAIER